ncbi:MAG: HTH-type transcriptional repressor FabR [Panacagrimonas sp.]
MSRRGEGSRLGRDARKQRTREALMEAALSLMGAGKGFTGLSLREVTREAGVVPTSFYRHFKDMDDLGLSLVEASGIRLRRLLREARKQRVPGEDIIRHSVRIYRDYLEQNRLHFYFVAGERGGGSPLIRAAIRAEVSHFSNEMASDLRHLDLFPQLSSASLRMICALVVTTMLNAAVDILDLPKNQPQAEREMMDHFVRQIRLIFIGAVHWRDAADVVGG